MTTTDERPTTTEFWTTENDQKLHLRGCPHLVGKDDVRRATDAEVAARVACVLCQKEIDGVGRTPCSSIDEAFRLLPIAPAHQAQVRSAVAETEHDEIWVVHSRTYIALGRAGRAVMWVHRTVMYFQDGREVTFAGYHPGSGGGARLPEQRRGEVCPEHFIEKSVSGRCESCD